MPSCKSCLNKYSSIDIQWYANITYVAKLATYTEWFEVVKIEWKRDPPNFCQTVHMCIHTAILFSLRHKSVFKSFSLHDIDIYRMIAGRVEAAPFWQIQILYLKYIIEVYLFMYSILLVSFDF